MDITEEWLVLNDACENGKRWFLKQSKTLATDVLQALLRENLFDWANWTITKIMSHEQQALFSCYAAKLSLKFFEKIYPTDKRPRQAILAATRYIKNPTNKNKIAVQSAESAAWSAARSAARSAEPAAESAAWSAVWLARSAARSAMWSAEPAAESAWSAARSAAWSAAGSAARSAARSAAWSAAESARSAARSATWKKILRYGINLLLKGDK